MKYIIYSFIFIQLFTRCSPQELHNEPTLTVNVNNTTNINTSSIAKITLNKDGKPILLGGISGFTAINKKNEFIVATHANPLMKFDPQTGTMLSEIGQIGRAANEYNAISDMWIEKDSLLAAYDFNTKQILHYNTTTCKFVNSSQVNKNANSNSFSMLCPIGENQYIGKSTYNGMPGVTTNELALYDKNYEFIKYIGDGTINSGITIGRNFAQYKNEVLYWQPFGRNIYNVKKDTIMLKYQIDFANMNIDPSKFEGDYELITHINANPTKYAGIISNLSENDNYVGFRFIHNSNMYLAIHNKSTRKTQCYLFNDSTDSTLINIFIIDKNVVLFYATPDENYIKYMAISELDQL